MGSWLHCTAGLHLSGHHLDVLDTTAAYMHGRRIAWRHVAHCSIAAVAAVAAAAEHGSARASFADGDYDGLTTHALMTVTFLRGWWSNVLCMLAGGAGLSHASWMPGSFACQLLSDAYCVS